MKKNLIRHAIRILFIGMWFIGIGTITRIMQGEVDSHNTFPCVLMAVIGISYFLVNIYRAEHKETDKMAQVDFGMMIEPETV